MNLRAPLSLLVLVVLLAIPVSQAGAHGGTAQLGATAFTAYGYEGAAFASFGARAAQAQPQPMEGVGRNMRLVANIPVEGATAGTDIELHGDHAYLGSSGEGLIIIDIKDPTKPRRVGKFSCPGGQNDPQISPDGQYAVMAIEAPSNKCHPNDEGFVVLDIRDKTNPREVAFVGRKNGLVDGAHNVTMDWPRLYVNQYTPTYNKFEIFDLSIPALPRSIGQLNGRGQAAHDLQVDHRPDGKVLAYAASIGFTDVLDVTDPTKPAFVQRFPGSEHGVGISHGAEPNFDRTLMLESDEYAGGVGNGACGGADGGSGPVPSGAVNSASPGALHLLRLAPDGKIKTLDPAGQKVDQVGAFNLPAQANDGPDEGCTAHVFWQAPDENRMVIAWYGRGTRVVDFSNPAAPVEVGSFVPKGANTWSAKPHKGYIFTGDINRGFDVLQYTGEKCERWPSTSGAAEVQRARYQGNVAPPAGAPRSVPAGCNGAPATDDQRLALTATPGQATTPGARPGGKRVGGYRFARRVRVPRARSARRTLTLEVRSANGRRVLARLRTRARSGRAAVLRASIGGPVGRYAWRIKAGRRVLKRGALTIKTSSRTRVSGASQTRVRVVRRSR